MCYLLPYTLNALLGLGLAFVYELGYLVALMILCELLSIKRAIALSLKLIIAVNNILSGLLLTNFSVKSEFGSADTPILNIQ